MPSLPILITAPHLTQYAAREAEIVAQAGRKHAITISTNMAGRGTDIILGGNPKVGLPIWILVCFLYDILNVWKSNILNLFYNYTVSF